HRDEQGPGGGQPPHRRSHEGRYPQPDYQGRPAGQLDAPERQLELVLIMKALAIVSPGRAEIVDLPQPSPGDGEVEIALAFVGYCGSDLTSYRGLNPLVTYPRVPGHEVAGTIVGL